MRTFSVAHLIWIIAVALLASVVPSLCRRKLVSPVILRYTLGGILAANELIRNLHDGFHFPNNLPIHLSTVLTWAAVIACFTLAPLAVEFTYFAGLVGAGMALLTPDLHSAPASYATTRYFISHGGIIVAATTLVFGKITRLERGALWRANGLVLIYAVFLGIFNRIFQVNYMYLSRKPKGPSILDLFGPWPAYLVVAELFCLGLFCLLSLAAQNFQRRTPERTPQRQPSGADRKGR